jgi:hypothetical protein
MRDQFSALDAARRDAVVPAQDVELVAAGIAGEERRVPEEVDKRAGLALLTSVRTINEPAQFADMDEHLWDHTLLCQANDALRRETVEVLEQRPRAPNRFATLCAWLRRSRDR